MCSFIILQFVNPLVPPDQRDNLGWALIAFCGLSVASNIVSVSYDSLKEILGSVKASIENYFAKEEFERLISD